jgi:ATP-dependent DNA helicase RecQ
MYTFPFRATHVLRPGQQQILEKLWMRQSVFANLPTGYGKSLAYFIPARDWNWRVWVVSPLLSLMDDQKAAAEAFGIPTFLWHRDVQSFSHRLDSFERQRSSLVFFSPERLLSLENSGSFRRWRDEGQLPDLIVFDELHCFETWGGFRTAFSAALSLFVRFGKDIPILGLSATLSTEEGRGWLRELGKDPATVTVGLGRENLAIRISPQSGESSLLVDLVEQVKDIQGPDSAIIYCRSREETEHYAQFFRALGIAAHPFHAGRPNFYRQLVTKRFREGGVPILFATSAFGMGIDYGRVRKVIHLSPPPSISALWQEAGRAGRDGNSAEAIIYFRRSDLWLEKISSRKEILELYPVWRLLWQKECRKSYIARFFGMQEKKCGICDWCKESWNSSAEIDWWMENSLDLKHWVKKNFFRSLKKS